MTVLGPEYAVINELELPYDPGPTEARRAAYRKQLIRSLIGFGLSIIIALLLFVIFRWNDPLIWFFYGVFGALNLFRVGWALGQLLYAGYHLKRMPLGRTAIRVDRSGMGIGTLGMPWDQVAAVRAHTPWWRKTSYLSLRPEGAPGTSASSSGLGLAPHRPWEITVAILAAAVAGVLVVVGTVLFITNHMAGLRTIGRLLEAAGVITEVEAFTAAGGLTSAAAILIASFAAAISVLVLGAVVAFAWGLATGQGRSTGPLIAALAIGIVLVPLNPLLMTCFLAFGVISVVLAHLPGSARWIETTSGAGTVRLDQLPASLATVDVAVRTLSGGRLRIDSRDLDR